MVEPIKKKAFYKIIRIEIKLYFFTVIGTTKKYHVIGTTK